MFKSIALFTLLLSFNIQAESFVSNEECIRVYRDNAVDLKQHVDDYNDGYLDKYDFSFRVTQISTIVSGRRLACLRFEAPDAKECVERYKKLYKSLRDQISVTSVLIGNQSSINDASLRFKAELLVHDLRCGF